MSASPYLRELYIDVQWNANGSERSTATWVESADGKRVCTMRPCDDDWSHAQSIAKAHNVAPKLAEALRLAAPIIDSFLNGQGAVTSEEMDAALMAAQAALAEWDAP